MLGFSWRNRFFVVIDRKGFILPLVYLDNLIEAIIASMLRDESTGQVYNVVDAEQVDKKRYMSSLIGKLYPGARVFYLPYGVFSRLVRIQEALFTVTRRKPMLTMYRMSSSQKPVLYSSVKIRNELDWKPSITFDEAVGKILSASTECHT
jgi:2-alkyl-3-oxoalkanoate reductase